MCYCTSRTCGLLESSEQQEATTTRNTKCTPDMGTTNNNPNNNNNNSNSFTTTKDTVKIRHSTTKITEMIRVFTTTKVTVTKVTRVVTVTKVTRVVTVTKVTRVVTVTRVTRVVTIKVIIQKVTKTRVDTKNRVTSSNSSNSSLLLHQEEEEEGEVEPGVLSLDLLLLPEVDHGAVVVLVVEHLREELPLEEVTLEDEVDNKDREEVLEVEEEPGVLPEGGISRVVLELREELDVGGSAVLGVEVVRPGEPVEVEVGISWTLC